VRFSPDGTWVATGGDDRRVRVWAYPELRLVGVLGVHASGITAVDFNGSGTRIASVAGNKNQPCIRVWDREQGSDPVNGGSDDQGLVKEIRHKLGKIDLEFKACRWALDGPSECLLAIMNAGMKGPGYLAKFDAKSFKLLKLKLIDSKAPLINMEISPSRQHLVIANLNGTLWIYDVKSFKCINEANNCHDFPCTALAWSPDGTMVCSGSPDNTVVFVPKQRPAPRSSFLLIFVHIVAVLLIYLVLCPDSSWPWALTS